jgi:hypothetical protein
VVQGGQLAVEVVGPIGDDRIERDALGDAEVQVDVGPSVFPAVRRGAGHRSSRDPRILLGEREQLPAQGITLIAGEHAAESSGASLRVPVVEAASRRRRAGAQCPMPTGRSQEGQRG